MSNYRQYFNIDPEYFPQVNEKIIKENPDVWKKFYPHTTFVNLIKNTVAMLNRSQKLSIWVEGAYGTGKSHAVLTLKKLLDSSVEETEAYFNEYDLDSDLCKRFVAAKSAKKILTVHRYGSSYIEDDAQLSFAIQESIVNALTEAGYGGNNNALKDGAIEWLSDEVNKTYFNALIAQKYSFLFAGDTAETIVKKLESFEGEALNSLMQKIFRVGKEVQITPFKLNTEILAKWIEDVINENNIGSLVFIWDEFTEYFLNNVRSLTGFQHLVELSASIPFYFIIVTHKSSALFDDTDKDKMKILDRFMKPTSVIELPENMAFQLMGAAMKNTDDPMMKEEWDEFSEDLYGRTSDSRDAVMKHAGIAKKELVNILPIHPYAALILKHISSAFDSNQRSMFDFIKNDRGEDIKGFQWYIDNYGPLDENPLLTVDMLWDFFYSTGKEYLSRDIRTILDSFTPSLERQLDIDEKRVLKTILLLQAIAERVGDDLDLFAPNAKNVDYAFEGSDLEGGLAMNIANALVNKKIIFVKPNGHFSAMINTIDIDPEVFRKNIEEIKKKPTTTLVNTVSVHEAVSLVASIKNRYVLDHCSSNDFDTVLRNVTNKAEANPVKIPAVIVFAKDDSESAAVSKKIAEAVKNNCKAVIIDASLRPLGKNNHEDYCENLAYSICYRGKNNDQANEYDKISKEILERWKKEIATCQFKIYAPGNTIGVSKSKATEVVEYLCEINKKMFPCGLESNYTLIDNMYTCSSLKAGAECGIKQELSQTFKSSNNLTKIDLALDGAWKIEKYWEMSPSLNISKIKIHVESVIQKAFNSDGRVAISTIYDALEEAPYGFIPCNITAFIIGFVLKEYANNVFTWSDGIVSDVLSTDKLKEMINEIVSHKFTPGNRYKEKYIVKMTDEEKKFNEVTSEAFDISPNLCTSVESTRDRIRNRMKELSFPVWCLKYVLDDLVYNVDIDIMEKVIDCYCGLANNKNLSTAKTDNDIAIEIGKICIKEPNVATELKKLLTKEVCTKGMEKYLQIYEDGTLINLASKINDGGQYINVLRKKFDADAANWVWNINTINEKIEEVILEYRIIFESNKIITKTTTFAACIKEWCDRCNNIRVSYPMARGVFGTIKPLIEILYNIKRANNILDSQKEDFFNAIVQHSEGFKDFYEDQIVVFKKACSAFIEKYSDEEVRELYKTIPGSFIMDKSDYFALVSDRVETYEKTSQNRKLKTLWKDLTNTESPRDWSKKYRMPILCVVDDSEFSKAKAAFDTVNRMSPDTDSINRAIDYIGKADFINKLSDENFLNKAFVEAILKDYHVMLKDIDEVKSYLESHVAADAYDWYGLPEIDKKLRAKAEMKYNQGGCNEALDKIDSLDVAEVKKFLKDLVKDNMTVGIEIIKDN